MAAKKKVVRRGYSEKGLLKDARGRGRPAMDEDTRKQSVSVRLSPLVIEMIDKVAASRSAFLEAAARRELGLPPRY